MSKQILREPESIERNFSWDDDKVYRWEMTRERSLNRGKLVLTNLGVLVLMPFLFFSLFWVLGRISQVFSFWVAVLATVMWSLSWLMQTMQSAGDSRAGQQQTRSRFMAAIVCMAAVAFLLFVDGPIRSGLSCGAVAT